SRRRHTRFSRDWSSDVYSSDLVTKDGWSYALKVFAFGICVDGKKILQNPHGAYVSKEITIRTSMLNPAVITTTTCTTVRFRRQKSSNLVLNKTTVGNEKISRVHLYGCKPRWL